MALLFKLSALRSLFIDANAQDFLRQSEGIFLCNLAHPLCSVLDQSTYGNHHFGGQRVRQSSGVADVLENGQPLAHYQSWLAEVRSKCLDTNVVRAWSAASALVDGARVLGGFNSARSGFHNAGQDDAQLEGLEIDVMYRGLR